MMLARETRRTLASLARRISQPTAATHPHLLREGELVPGATVDDVCARRAGVLEGMDDNSVLVVPNNTTRYSARDIPYPYKSNACFTYLTGSTEPDAAIVLSKDKTGRMRSVYFARARDAHAEAWEGPRLGAADAREMFGVDDADVVSSDAFERLLRGAMGNGTRVFLESGANVAMEGTVRELAGRRQVLEAGHVVDRMRVIKAPAEIALMRRSAANSAAGVRAMMAATRPGVGEWELANLFEYTVRSRGSDRLAYPCIVAGGANALAIHYLANDMLLREGDCVLVDSGGEFGNYASDISRTWPVGDDFADATQRDFYTAMVELQRKCVAMVRPGNSMYAIYMESLRLTGELLQSLGLPVRTTSQVREYYLHDIGHHLGMDTHDTSTISGQRPLEPGMVVTIEPGVYLPDDARLPPSLRNLGIRLEDDIVVTSDGHENLTEDVPLDAADVLAAKHGA